MTPKQNATSPTLVGRFLLSHAVVFFFVFFFRNQAPERRSGVLGGRSTSQIPFQACCASLTMLGPRLVEPQHIELAAHSCTTHRRLGGSDTSRRHAHLMSANDAHPSVFAESTRTWPLRPSNISGHSPLHEALAAQRLHSKRFDESSRSKPTPVGSDQS